MTRNMSKGHAPLALTIGVPLGCALALVLGAFRAPNAQAYPYYDNGSGQGCVQCHSEFQQNGGILGPLHQVHRFSFGISGSDCNLCHPNGGGSTPVATFTSGPVNGQASGFGCVGCHGRDYGETSPNSGLAKATGYGLRQHHVNNAVAGCPGCHQPGQQGHPNPLPPILPENVPPPYYGQLSVNLVNPCASLQEDTTWDLDAIGLDNDGDGAADYPADLDCPPTTTTSTTTTTTTTTLPVGCAVAPVGGCVAPGKAVLSINEKSAGKEKLKVTLTKLQSAVTQGQFGDPVSGSTSYAICIYDELNQLSGEISVARAGDDCDSKPCFGQVSTKGYKYRDKQTTADGILKMVMSGGDVGKGKVSVIGKNNALKSQNSLPTGIAPLLQNNASATVQVITSDAACFGATVTQVKKADGLNFSAVGP